MKSDLWVGEAGFASGVCVKELKKEWRRWQFQQLEKERKKELFLYFDKGPVNWMIPWKKGTSECLVKTKLQCIQFFYAFRYFFNRRLMHLRKSSQTNAIILNWSEIYKFLQVETCP